MSRLLMGLLSFFVLWLQFSAAFAIPHKHFAGPALPQPLLASATLHARPTPGQPIPQYTVNAVIGDTSFIEKFGHPPAPDTPESLRLRTHLEYVEAQLRKNTPAEISPQLYPMRRKLLNTLHSYTQAGVFPQQQAYAGRRPHFIDEQGRLCAVGHLIAQSAGLGLAQKINSQYSYAYLPEMKLPELQAWVKGSGFSLQELAMIQPSYNNRSYLPLEPWGVYSILTQALYLAHIGAVFLEPEDYLAFQPYDQAITYSLLAGYGVYTATLAIDRSDSSGGQVLALGAMLFLTSLLLNGAFLLALDSTMHWRIQEREKDAPVVSLGSFPMADGGLALGLHSTLVF